jgi:uncharacterized RDD family membrane protein YckC
MTETLLPPSLSRRLGCLLYELLLMAALLLIATAVFLPLKNRLPADLGLALQRLFLLGILFAYFGLSWVKGGQTVAMKAWRIRLVTDNGREIGWGLATFRFCVALFLFVAVPLVAYLGMQDNGVSIARMSLLWCMAPFCWAYFDPHGQCLQDRLCHTRLILREKSSAH